MKVFSNQDHQVIIVHRNGILRIRTQPFQFVNPPPWKSLQASPWRTSPGKLKRFELKCSGAGSFSNRAWHFSAVNCGMLCPTQSVGQLSSKKQKLKLRLSSLGTNYCSVIQTRSSTSVLGSFLQQERRRSDRVNHRRVFDRGHPDA